MTWIEADPISGMEAVSDDYEPDYDYDVEVDIEKVLWKIYNSVVYT